jgi:CheY-like chemotaxis protein
MEEDPQVPVALRSQVSMIRRNVELEARLIDDLLDSNRIAAGKVELNLELVDAHVLLRRAAEVCQSDLDSKRQQLVWDLSAPDHFVRGDVVRLQQVFWNLIRNAVKFTPAGGRITVRTEESRASTDSGAQMLTISVTDTGIGIDPEVLPRLFQSFEQGGRDITRQFGGLGLGLAISKALVDLHGGTISAHSPGRTLGATFTVITVSLAALPAPAASVATRPPRPRSATGTPGLRILLVEDHIDTQRATARFLRSLGHNVHGAGCAADARKAAAGEVFDLVISDLGLPDGSGLDLMRMLKTECHLRGIALSGYGMEEDIRNSRDAGFDYHLTKPVPAQQLEAVLQQMASQVEE